MTQDGSIDGGKPSELRSYKLRLDSSISSYTLAWGECRACQHAEQLLNHFAEVLSTRSADGSYTASHYLRSGKFDLLKYEDRS